MGIHPLKSGYRHPEDGSHPESDLVPPPAANANRWARKNVNKNKEIPWMPQPFGM
jgi:hypothetical protein